MAGRNMSAQERARIAETLGGFFCSPSPLLFSEIPEHLRDLADGVPDLDTPVWYSGSLGLTREDGETNTHWWERLRKRLRRRFGR